MHSITAYRQTVHFGSAYKSNHDGLSWQTPHDLVSFIEPEIQERDLKMTVLEPKSNDVYPVITTPMDESASWEAKIAPLLSESPILWNLQLQSLDIRDPVYNF
jgi:hypothetical protein